MAWQMQDLTQNPFSQCLCRVTPTLVSWPPRFSLLPGASTRQPHLKLM